MKILSAIWLSMLLVVLSLTAAMIGQKPIAWGAHSFTLSWVLQAGVFGLTVLLTVLFGWRYALKVVITNSICYLLAMLAIKLAIVVPADVSWTQQAWYAQALAVPWLTIRLTFIWLLVVQAIVIGVLSYFLKTAQQKSSMLGLFPFICMIFVMSLLVSNLTTQKIAHLVGITVDVGTLFFPITYIFNNIFTEVYGYKRSRVAIWGGLLGNLLMIALLQLVVELPHASGWQGQAVYQAIMGSVPRIVLASTLAFFFGEFVNSYVLAKFKILTSGKYLWTRTIGSTVFGVAVDSLVFSFIAFYGTVPIPVVLAIAGWEYVLKVGYEVVATPITLRVIRWIKRQEHEDRYDRQTRFNPFLLKDVKY